MKLRRTIPPMLDPPYYWGLGLDRFTGPSAARNMALQALWLQSKDPKESEAAHQALRELYASAWREDVPEEDREWAEAYRRTCSSWVNRRRLGAIAQCAYEGYLQSSDGIFNGRPARPWPSLSHHDAEPWLALAGRVEDAPEGESELATAKAASRAYWDYLWVIIPPWDSDPAQVHWLAAVRAARAKVLAEDVPPEKAY